jgi:hypothetical protein
VVVFAIRGAAVSVYVGAAGFGGHRDGGEGGDSLRIWSLLYGGEQLVEDLIYSCILYQSQGSVCNVSGQISRCIGVIGSGRREWRINTLPCVVGHPLSWNGFEVL